MITHLALVNDFRIAIHELKITRLVLKDLAYGFQGKSELYRKTMFLINMERMNDD